MKITQVSITRGITVNIGNYESERYDITLTAEVDSDHELTADVLFAEAGRLLALELVGKMAREKARKEKRRLHTTEQTVIENTYACAEYGWIKQLYLPYAENIVSMLAQEAK